MLAGVHDCVLSTSYTDIVIKTMFILAFSGMFLIMDLLVEGANVGRKLVFLIWILYWRLYIIVLIWILFLSKCCFFLYCDILVYRPSDVLRSWSHSILSFASGWEASFFLFVCFFPWFVFGPTVIVAEYCQELCTATVCTVPYIDSICFKNLANSAKALAWLNNKDTTGKLGSLELPDQSHGSSYTLVCSEAVWLAHACFWLP